MLITIRVPDGTTQLLYTEIDKDGWECEPKKLQMGMYVKVEQEGCDGYAQQGTT